MKIKSIKSKFLTTLCAVSWLSLTFSCTNPCKDEIVEKIYDSGIINLDLPKDTTVYLLSGEKFIFNYEISKGEITTGKLPNGWVVNKKTDAGINSIEVTAPAWDHITDNYVCDLVLGSTDKNVTQKEIVKIRMVDLTAKGGTFMLSEGNMTNETGTVCYISPEGLLIDTLYRRVNGSKLGNVCQDMFISNGKGYIISQNGTTGKGEDGMLIVVDAKSFKKTNAFTNEDIQNSGISGKPKYVASFDGNTIYIRDNRNNLYKFDASTKRAELIEKMNGAPNIPFVSIDNKMYYVANNTIKELDMQTNQIKQITLPTKNFLSIDKIIDLLPADDGKLWILGQQNSDKTFGIFKYNLKNPGNETTSLQCNVLHGYKTGWGNAHTITANGNDVFYYNGMKINKLSFDENAKPVKIAKEDKLVWENTPEVELYKELSSLSEDAKMIYNAFAVNPVTQQLCFYTIKGYGPDYKMRSIWGLSLDKQSKISEYKNVYGSFAAGFWINK